MKKILFVFLVIIIFIFSFMFFHHTSDSPNNDQTENLAENEEYIDNSTSSINTPLESNDEQTGAIDEQSTTTETSTTANINWLHTSGSKLLNEKNEEIQLRGISSHGIGWFYDVLTYENLETLKNDWNINVFRIAMYTDPNSQGYISNPQETLNKVTNIVDMAVQLDMYVIIDWHILNDNDPLIYKEQSKTFFDEVSSKYADIPNVIYEICNEPNGNNITWEGNVKPYAEEIIPIIRNNSENSLIIVGTPDWCKDLTSTANNPLNFDNVVYSCHFYSGTHGSELREKIDYCVDKNIPIFVSECGLTDASGNGGVYFDKFNEWVNYLNSKNISWVYWSFCNKNESSAILSSSYTPSSSNVSLDESNNNTSSINDYLTEAGKFIKDIFKSY